MARLTRVLQKVFGKDAPSGEMKKFGSLAAGAPANAATVDEVQDLAEFEDGWFEAVTGLNSPAIEDMNGLFWLCFYQLAYQFQSGVPEWDTDTEYHEGSFINDDGVLKVSVQDTNQGEGVDNGAWWREYRDPKTLTALQNISTREFVSENAVQNNAWSGVAYSPSLNFWVVVAATGTNRVLVSDDGIFWSVDVLDAAEAWESVCWSESLGLFVAVSSSATTPLIAYSSDGTSWTYVGSPSDTQLHQVIWCEELGYFVAIEQGTTNFCYSANGIAWTLAVLPDTCGRSLAYSPSLQRVVCNALDGSFMYSDNGTSFTQTSVYDPGGGDGYSCLARSDDLGIFLALPSYNATPNTHYAISEDGITWTLEPILTSDSASHTDVKWNSSLGLFLISVDTLLYTSPDGYSFDLKPTGTSESPAYIGSSEELSMFVVTTFADEILRSN